MENFSLDDFARRSFNNIDSPQQCLVDVFELAICALSKEPATTFKLLGQFNDACYEADETVNAKNFIEFLCKRGSMKELTADETDALIKDFYKQGR